MAHFHSSGVVPDVINVLYIIDNGADSTELSSLSTRGWKLSGPGYFDIFKSFNFFFTLSSVISILSSLWLILEFTAGKSLSTSTVNTDEKKSANTSAFSLSLDVVSFLSLV